VTLADGAGGLAGVFVRGTREMLGGLVGEAMLEPRPENTCAPKTAIPAATTTAPTTNNASRIHHPPKPLFTGVPGNGAP
jgi:hypothetical protein